MNLLRSARFPTIKNVFITGSVVVAGFLIDGCSNPRPQLAEGFDGTTWVTSADRSKLFEQQPTRLSFSEDRSELPSIDIDPVQRLQEIEGFGFSLTGGSAALIDALPGPEKEALLHELILTDAKNIGVSYLRISIGGSDLDDHAYSCDDLPVGKTDPALNQFSLTVGGTHVIPILKKIIALNPHIKILATPWSAPAWMKTNRSLRGGSLKPEFYSAYANYFVKYIKAMKKEGIVIDAVTIQNEPENPKNNPSMLMSAEEQVNFIKDHLGLAFRRDSITTKIIASDNNCDNSKYPITVMDDGAANKFIAGAAFHLYDGHIDTLSVVHLSHPDRNMYFTEQWTSGREKFSKDLMWHGKNVLIGAPRNWSVNVLEWNLASDPWFNPHTNAGGCTECLGALTIGKTVKKNVAYYIIAHASKFVRPGSVRVASNSSLPFQHVAFVTPENKKVLIVLNDTDQDAKFGIHCLAENASASLPKHSIGTFIW